MLEEVYLILDDDDDDDDDDELQHVTVSHVKEIERERIQCSVKLREKE
jgi:hypothetical protein